MWAHGRPAEQPVQAHGSTCRARTRCTGAVTARRHLPHPALALSVWGRSPRPCAGSGPASVDAASPGAACSRSRAPTPGPAAHSSAAEVRHSGTTDSGDDPSIGSVGLMVLGGGAGSFRPGTGRRERLVSTPGLAGSPEAGSLCPLPAARPNRARPSHHLPHVHTPIPSLTHTSTADG